MDDFANIFDVMIDHYVIKFSFQSLLIFDIIEEKWRHNKEREWHHQVRDHIRINESQFLKEMKL